MLSGCWTNCCRGAVEYGNFSTQMTMAEPSTTSVSITAFLIALLGPLAGQYSIIVMAALAGSMWPLSTMAGTTKISGTLFLLRVVGTAVTLSSAGAWLIEKSYGLPAHEAAAVAAFMIGALGNGWTTVFRGLRDGIIALIGTIGGGGK